MHTITQPRTQTGFTLIELLIVIAIVGTLATIAVPRYIGYRERAAITACEQELAAAMTALVVEGADMEGDGDDLAERYHWSACDGSTVGYHPAKDDEPATLSAYASRFSDQEPDASEQLSEVSFGNEINADDV
ncbi:prepilin-type N-terminal cleavage/methylation domain-containing protein [Aidingimonas halophila]|uniref:Prepilin-type N-terminal cleavage/methylation domain-containing protein n=1 Tax=Aidingimonas halophila TaxID=574349 RepID=A0A1H3D6T4_9GAMM|nr:prepilin-type N-terminal cleavage/methylation domain-containing protein [Aidingimonas halophila]GHC30538.1 hypothetical protein GCM10008094_23590 [Aidingimonas halophila]SDX61389.1 prepilin-type N-terminal cleavage/methylation domain-containing protein [Aidingimonas halophila]